MKKFRHKRTGIIGTLKEDGHLHFERSGGGCSAYETIWKGFVENSCDWEEIKQPLLTTYDGVELFINDTCYIPQKKIDGGWHNTYMEFIVTKSMVSNWRSDVVIFADKNKAEEFIKQNTLTLTTKDGVSLKFGDIFYTVDVDRFKVYEAFVGETFQKDKWTNNAFSTKELAEEWIENNQPKYSLSDISKSVNFWSMSPICKQEILKFLER
jgi:hypothetical protein